MLDGPATIAAAQLMMMMMMMMMRAASAAPVRVIDDRGLTRQLDDDESVAVVQADCS